MNKSRGNGQGSRSRTNLPRFLIFSLNPAIDAEWQVDDMVWEEKNLVHSQRRWAGGKGANVARWIALLGSRAELVVPLGGPAGDELERYLQADSVKARVIRMADETRVNVVITNKAGRQMRFNQLGATLTAAHWKTVTKAARDAGRAGAAIVLSGSLPPGSPSSRYAEMIRLAHRENARVFLDCDGATLSSAVRAKPFLVKPNRHELSTWAGKPLADVSEVRGAAGKMSAVTNGWVLVSLSADGALLVNSRQRFIAHATSPAVRVINTLGAGDATLAAAADAAMRGLDPIEWLRSAVAAGTAATQAPPGMMVTRRAYEQLRKQIAVTIPA